MHSSRMRAVCCSGRSGGRGCVCLGGAVFLGVCIPACNGADPPLHLTQLLLRTVIINDKTSLVYFLIIYYRFLLYLQYIHYVYERHAESNQVSIKLAHCMVVKVVVHYIEV